MKISTRQKHLFLLLLSAFYMQAQVGIGTTSPQANLDIPAVNEAAPNNTDGILIPRITIFPAINPTSNQHGMMVFLTTSTTFLGNPKIPGFYYWNNPTLDWIAVGNNITTGWQLTGNAGTSVANNFIGTTDDIDLIFRRNNLRAGRLGSNNTSFGLNSLNPATTGTRNTAIGSNVLNANTTGTTNTAIGENTLVNNSSGGENAAMGAGALFSNTVGNQNTAIGRNALTTNSTGSSNTGLGYLTLRNNTIGEFNTAVGRAALINNVDGNENTAVGVNALSANTTGAFNSVLGVQAGRNSTAGSNNTSVGFQSLFSNLIGNNNVAIGNQAGYFETGSNKLYVENSDADADNALIYGEFDTNILRTNSTFQIGNPAGTGYQFPVARGTDTQILQTNATGVLSWVSPTSVETDPTAWRITGNTGIIDGTNYIGTAGGTNVDVAFRRNNVAAGKISSTSTSFGVGALTSGAASNSTAFGNNALANSTGAANVAVGTGALAANTTSANSTAVGFNALAANTAANNTAFGFQTLAANTAGVQNTAIGVNALQRKTTGSANTAVGHSALNAIGTFDNATAVGFEALLANTASNNTALGFQALRANSGGQSNTAVGFQALVLNTGGQANTAVGHLALAGINNNASQDNTAVGFRSFALGTGNITRSTAVGAYSLENSTALSNTAIGFGALRGANGVNTGVDNTAIGREALRFNTSGFNNVGIGSGVLAIKTTGNSNVAIGVNALGSNVTGSGNVAIGNSAGFTETGSNKLYISNSNTDATNSLIYGEFAPNILRTNSTFQIGDPAGSGYQFPVARGTNSQILQTDATGVLNWVDTSSLTISETDPQVSSSAINAVPKWDGSTLVDGIITDNGTSANIAGNANVAGNTTTTTFQMTNGATTNYILQSDAAGNATWVPNPLTTLSAMRINLSANQALATTGWQKLQFDTALFDTKSEFAGGTFTASTAGIYQVNAGYHTNSQTGSSQFYSIGVYVNGGLYQQTSSNHLSNGPVPRNITCMVNLTAGDTIEIYVENYETTVEIDSFTGKSFFEVQQIR